MLTAPNHGGFRIPLQPFGHFSRQAAVATLAKVFHGKKQSPFLPLSQLLINILLYSPKANRTNTPHFYLDSARPKFWQALLQAPTATSSNGALWQEGFIQ